MLALLTFLFVLVLSLLVVRVATVALTLTGMSRPSAQFQARSAWTGTGFTTSESEGVVSSPVRRRIITLLMVLRGAGLVGAASTLIVSFGQERTAGETARIWGMLIGGLLLVWALAQSSVVDRWLTEVVRRVLSRWGDFDPRNYEGLLHIGGEYDVAEAPVEPGGWLDGQTLGALGLPDEGVLVLGVTRPGGEYLGAPRGGTVLGAGDLLMLYGRADALDRLSRRRKGIAGELARTDAVAAARQRQAEEAARDPEGGGAPPPD